MHSVSLPFPGLWGFFSPWWLQPCKKNVPDGGPKGCLEFQMLTSKLTGVPSSKYQPGSFSKEWLRTSGVINV